MTDLKQIGAAKQEAEHCLRHMDALAGEIRIAIHAIAANALPILEISVGRQGALAAGLVVAVSRLRTSSTGLQNKDLPPDLDSRLRRGVQNLSALNEEYAALLSHSGHSVRLLCALHGGEAGQDGRHRKFRGDSLRQQVSSWEG